MSELRDVYPWERRYGGTIMPPLPLKPRRSRCGLSVAFVVAGVVLCIAAALIGVSR